MTPELATIIEEAYRVFSGPVPDSLGICTCARCTDPAIIAGMLATPLHEISAEDVREYNWCVDLEGEEEAVRTGVLYLLPRIMELLAEGETLASSDPCLALRRLGQRNTREALAPQRQDVIDRFFDAFLRASSTDSDDLETALVLAVLGGGETERLLCAIAAVPDPATAISLAYMRRLWVEGSEADPRFTEPFLKDMDAQRDIGRWLVSPPITARIEALLTHTDPEIVALAQEALTRGS